jgi:hypothetical protein
MGIDQSPDSRVADSRVAGFESWYRDEHPRLLAAMAVVARDTEVAGEVTA